MGAYFRREPEPSRSNSRIYASDIAKLELKRSRRETANFLERIELRIEECTQSAKRFALLKDRRNALLALQLRKMYTATKDKLNNALYLLESQMLSLDQAEIDASVFAAIQQGSTVLLQSSLFSASMHYFPLPSTLYNRASIEGLPKHSFAGGLTDSL